MANNCEGARTRTTIERKKPAAEDETNDPNASLARPPALRHGQSAATDVASDSESEDKSFLRQTTTMTITGMTEGDLEHISAHLEHSYYSQCILVKYRVHSSVRVHEIVSLAPYFAQ